MADNASVVPESFIGSPQQTSRAAIFEKPSIASQMPITFASTGFVVNQFSTSCGRCGHFIAGEFVRGNVTHPMDSVAVVDGIAVCPVCEAATKVKTRFHSDHRITFLSKRGWVVMKAQAPSFLAKLIAFFFGTPRERAS